MTSISNSTSTPMPFAQQALQRDVAAGSVSSTDETALTAAIGDISTELQSGATSATGTTATSTSTATAPTSMKDRVDGLIDDQVSSGKLTTDQGSELKGVFAQAHAHMHGAHGHHGGGGGGGEGGALDSLLASLTGSSSTDASTTDPVTGVTTSASTATSTDTTSSTSSTNTLATSATTAVAALEAFLNQFKAAIGSNGTYSANGQGNTSPLSVLVNSIG